MERKLVLTSIIVILLTNLLGLTFRIEKMQASGTIYIRTDGSIDPPTANITTADSVTYTFTDNNYDKIVVERDNILLDGQRYILQGTGSGYGITLLGRCNVTLRNIEINAFVIGVWLNSSSNNTVSGNNITNNEYGIYLYASSNNNTISGNNITNNEIGSRFYSSSSNTVSGNNITNNGNGVILNSSSNNTFSGNNIIANNFNGIYLYSSSSNTISSNNMTDNDAGVILYTSSSNTVSGNNITDNDSYGVYLHNSCNNSTVSGNSFVGDGLRVSYSFGNVVVDNLVNGKPLVYLEDVSDLVVEDAGQVILVNCNRIRVENLTLSNTTVGAQLWNTNSTTITGNNITGNVEGVFLRSSFNNTVSGNHITDNEIGSRFYYSFNNTVSGNNITDNDAGVYLYASSNNTIYHNNFINNTYQAQTNNFPDNIWDNDYPSGGNYWSDYNGTDFYSGLYQNETGSDGIGDTLCIIDENNRDNYPLMKPWTPTPSIPTTINELKIEIEELGLQDEIGNQGIVTSLLAKLNVAQKLIDNGKIDQAKTILEAFISQVQNLLGIHITPEAADILIESAEYILSHL